MLQKISYSQSYNGHIIAMSFRMIGLLYEHELAQPLWIVQEFANTPQGLHAMLHRRVQQHSVVQRFENWSEIRCGANETNKLIGNARKNV